MRTGARKRSIGVVILSLVLVASCNFPGAGDEPDAELPPPGSAPTGDYGDAPDGGETGYPELFAQDGSFPTLYGSNGARTLSIDEATLGPTASIEVDANDPADPDGVQNLTNTDSDDGLVDFFITLNALPPPTTLSVNVVGPEGSPGGTFYINAVIDLNMDGEWGGQARPRPGTSTWVVSRVGIDTSQAIVRS